jgi:hypothetical protein
MPPGATMLMKRRDTTREHNFSTTARRPIIRANTAGRLAVLASGDLGPDRQGARPLDRRDKGVAAPRNIGDVPCVVVAVAKDFSETSEMDPQAPVLDDHIRPDPIDQFTATNQLTRLPHEGDQDVEGAATNGDRFFSFDKQSSRRGKPEWTKRDGLVGLKRCSARHRGRSAVISPFGLMDLDRRRRTTACTRKACSIPRWLPEND